MAKPYDLVVLGGGSAGLVAAMGAARLGARVALVEKHLLGGECLHTGCVPSKALLKAAEVAHLARRAGGFGVETGPVSADLARVMAYVRRAVETVGEHDRPEVFERAGADVVFGRPRFESDRCVMVDDRRLEFRHCLVSTGSSPRVPPVPGLEEAGFLTNDTLWGLERLPERLLVLGGGPIGCEMAQAFGRLGSRVTLVHRGPRLLPKEDPEASEVVARVFRAEGIDVRLEARLAGVRREKGVRVCRLGTDEEEVDEILVAVGRRANVDGLDLPAAGVETDARGFVRADGRLRTTARGIWAAGDVHGRFMFTHTAEHEARSVLLQALFRLPVGPSYRVVPWATFTDPEVARVGAVEGEGLSAWSFPAGDVDRAVAEGHREGFHKILTDRRGRIAGATLVCAHAGELIHEVILAMQKRLRPTDLSQAIHVYPTRAQGTRKAADRYSLEHAIPGWILDLARRIFGYEERPLR